MSIENPRWPWSLRTSISGGCDLNRLVTAAALGRQSPHAVRCEASAPADRRGSVSTMPVKQGFPPVFDPRARVLILGSLPGDESLRKRQYYGHPQNQFWALLAAVFGSDLPRLDYERKCAFLLRKRIALWDVLEAAERRGSLDAAIRNERTNDLPALFAKLPRLRAVGCNGGKAHRSFCRHFGAWLHALPGEVSLCRLPSSSPAYAAMSLDAKVRHWRQFLDAALAHQ